MQKVVEGGVGGMSRTEVRGLRATAEFWEKCDVVAGMEGRTRNEMIVDVIADYCDGRLSELIVLPERWGDGYGIIFSDGSFMERSAAELLYPEYYDERGNPKKNELTEK